MTNLATAAWSLTTGLALTIGIFLAALMTACTIGFALLVAWDWMRAQAAGRRVDAFDEFAETYMFPADEFIEGDFRLWACELRGGA